jgi:hypothetical protein
MSDDPTYPLESGASHTVRLFLPLGFGTFGNVGVTGITFGGVLAGRLAACLASASAM